MRFLILLFMTSLCFASPKNYVPLEGWNECNLVDTRYSSLEVCENSYSKSCIDVTDKNCNYDKIVDVEYDDYSKPLTFDKQKETSCEGQECYLMKHSQNCEIVDGVNVCTYFCSDFPGYKAEVNEAEDQVYCVIPVSWEKKIVKELKEDPVKKAAYEAEQAAKEQAKLDKAAAKEAAKTALLDCKSNDKFDKECFQKALELLLDHMVQ